MTMTTTSYEQELERSGRILITIKGISMRPLFHSDTDAILVEKRPPEKLGDLDIVLFKRGVQYVLHRIVGKRPDGRYIIAGDNCMDADIVRPEDILGVVIAAQRSGKPIKLEGIRYSLYETLWCRPYRFRFAVLRCWALAKRTAKKILRRSN